MSGLLDSPALAAADFPYTSRRMPFLAPNGAVAATSSLAASAGLRMLLRGGNAVDAAVATAATLTVVEPTQNGIGADAFAIVWDGTKLHGLNGSGRAPATLTADVCYGLGLTEMPRFGWPAVTVPGAPRAWRDIHDRFGRLPFDTLFEPAVSYAEGGFPLGPQTANAWDAAQQRLPASNTAPEYEGWAQTFAPDGRAARAGDLWRLPGHAATLRRIAETGSDAFYRGEIAERIAAWAAKTGGYMTEGDLAAHTSTWVDPVRVGYHGFDVWEMPPNCQGIVTLEALGILDGLDVARTPRESVESYHTQIEALKLAFADAYTFLADPAQAEVPVEKLLSPSYLAQQRARITDVALRPPSGEPPAGGTVLLVAADSHGMMVAFIQSNYIGFGSGIVVPGTGIALQNRGSGFSLKQGHPNLLAPGKRSYHTLMPGFLTYRGEAVGPFGVMGTEMQPQGHLQMVVNQVDYGMNPQASLDAPRYRWFRDLDVHLEPGVPSGVAEGLAARGHAVQVREGYFGPAYGRGHIIRRLSSGAYLVGTETRADGCVAGY